jgi:starch synthase
MHVLFAAAELSPLARVGGLGEVAAGLVTALRSSGVDVTVVAPDYSDWPLAGETVTQLVVPEWAAPARARTGTVGAFGAVTLVETAQIRRSHPYVDPSTRWGWHDNDRRFFGFSAAVAALADELRPDVVHLNDWHTAAAAGFLARRRPTVFAVHNLAYQGHAHPWWIGQLGPAASAFEWAGMCNPMAGALRLADRIVAVSPTYAEEIVRPQHGFGLDGLLRQRRSVLSGILNGIDTDHWDPTRDEHLAAKYGAPLDADGLAGKEACRAALRQELGLPEVAGPVIGVVGRLVEQKGIDLGLELVRFLEDVPAQLTIVGAGERGLAEWAGWAAGAHPTRVSFREGYDDGLGHRVFGGADLYLMPSRFEPCGLSQMQAMRYGAIPVVTDVGGLHDTVVDADRDRAAGTGFVSRSVDAVGMLDALHRADRAWRNRFRRLSIQRRGMARDWSWRAPAARYLALYEELVADGRRS